MAKGRWPTLHTYGMLLNAARENPEGEPVRVNVGYNDFGQYRLEQSYEDPEEGRPVKEAFAGLDQALAQAERTMQRVKEPGVPLAERVWRMLANATDDEVMQVCSIVKEVAQNRGLMG